MSKKTLAHKKMHCVCRVKRSGHGAWYPYITPVKDGVIVLAPRVREKSHNRSSSDRACQVFLCEAIRRASELLLSCVESVRLEAREHLQAYGYCRRRYPRMI
jgi:hypothetical protein